MKNKRKVLRRSSDSHITVVNRKRDGQILMIAGSAIGASYLFAIQFAILFFNPDISRDVAEAKSFMFYIFAVIILGALMGSTKRLMKSGYYRFCGAVLGLTFGYIGTLIFAIYLTDVVMYRFVLMFLTLSAIVVFFSSEEKSEQSTEIRTTFAQ